MHCTATISFSHLYFLLLSFQFVALSALLAVARAGNLLAAGPALAYSAAPAVSHVTYATAAVPAAPIAFHAPAIGTSHQSTVRSLDGNAAVSHYSKAVDTAFSSVRKFDTRITNDGRYLTPALSYAAAAPIVKTAPALSYAAAPALGYAHAAPALSYGAPALGYAHAAPALSYAHAAPIVKTAPALSYAAPALSYAAGAPIVKAAPAFGYAAPANVVAHAAFTGYGTSYAW